MNIFKTTRLLCAGNRAVLPLLRHNLRSTTNSVCSFHRHALTSQSKVLTGNLWWCPHGNRTGQQMFSAHQVLQHHLQYYCTKESDKTSVPDKGDEKTEEAKLSIFARFKKAYKEHGKVLIGVHVATSVVWFGSFFYVVHTGFDIIPLLEGIGFSEKLISPFRNSSLGDTAVAYLMYKLATPARYTVTLAGTNYAIKYLRKKGRIPAQEEKLRDLYKDSRREVSARFNERRKKLSSNIKLRQRKFSTLRQMKDPSKTLQHFPHKNGKKKNGKGGSH